MNILGIDYGRSRTGLALSLGYFARPLEVISKPKDLLKVLRGVVKSNQIDLVVMGQPKGSLGGEVAKLAQRIENELQLPVELIGEDLTTVEAEELLKMYGLRNLKKYPIDALAAAAILQDWIDAHRDKLV